MGPSSRAPSQPGACVRPTVPSRRTVSGPGPSAARICARTATPAPARLVPTLLRFQGAGVSARSPPQEA